MEEVFYKVKENAKWNLKLFNGNKGKQRFTQKTEYMIGTK